MLIYKKHLGGLFILAFVCKMIWFKYIKDISLFVYLESDNTTYTPFSSFEEY
jgi:hypothetical protein